MKTIKDIDIKGKTVLVRVDYNVPLKDGKVTSDLRIRASLPTIEYLREHEVGKIILISHLGRPDGRDDSLSLSPVADRLGKLTTRASFVDEVTGPKVEEAIAKMKPGDILLLENLRFFPGEEANDPDFMKSIVDATKADLYVQDGFAVIHRAHASTDAIKNYLPVYAGLLLEKEITNLESATKHPKSPVLIIIGDAKVDDKQPLIDKFLDKSDHIVIGGKIAADGYKPTSDKIYVAEDFDEDAEGHKLDIGPLSTSKIASFITDANTIVWNGCLGKTEDPAYATASTIIAEMIGEKQDATTIICGGDTTGFVENLIKVHPNLHYSLVSTGGGASLEFLLGKPLPGLESIKE